MKDSDVLVMKQLNLLIGSMDFLGGLLDLLACKLLRVSRTADQPLQHVVESGIGHP